MSGISYKRVSYADDGNDDDDSSDSSDSEDDDDDDEEDEFADMGMQEVSISCMHANYPSHLL